MKKKLCLLAALFISGQMLFAIPAGEYYDNRGNLKVLVAQDGKTVHCLDSNGKVRSTFMVTKEESNGRFFVKRVFNGQLVGAENPNNAWWRENGKIYLNLTNQASTLVLR